MLQTTCTYANKCYIKTNGHKYQEMNKDFKLGHTRICKDKGAPLIFFTGTRGYFQLSQGE